MCKRILSNNVLMWVTAFCQNTATNATNAEIRQKVVKAFTTSVTKRINIIVLTAFLKKLF